MNRIVFTKNLNLAAKVFGYPSLTKTINKEGLSDHGLYTSVRTYSDYEIISLQMRQGSYTQIPAFRSKRTFDIHPLGVFQKSHSVFCGRLSSAFGLLESTKNPNRFKAKTMFLYVDTRRFETEIINKKCFRVNYHSD